MVDATAVLHKIEQCQVMFLVPASKATTIVGRDFYSTFSGI
jgi:hypothetical protein